MPFQPVPEDFVEKDSACLAGKNCGTRVGIDDRRRAQFIQIGDHGVDIAQT